MAPLTPFSYAAAAAAANASSTNRAVASTSNAPSTGASSKPSWDNTPDTGDWSIKSSGPSTSQEVASTYTSPSSKPAWDNSPHWSADKWAAASGEVASDTDTSSSILWTAVAPVTDGKRFAKFKGHTTTYLACLSTCTSAAAFQTDVVPQLDDALLAGYRFSLAYHHEMFGVCLEHLQARRVPKDMVIVYFGKYDDAGKMSALEREGYRVKYVKGDNEKGGGYVG